VADFFIGAGDTASALFETLEDETGAAVDIQGATVTVTITPIHGGTPIVNAHAANNLQVGDGSDGTRGEVSYGEGANPWGSATATAGDYLYSWTVTFAGGAVQTFPNDGYRLLTITPDAPTTATSDYVSRDEFKKTLNLQGESYADQDIDVAIQAAARGLEKAYNDRPWVLRNSGETRYYTAYSPVDVMLGDCISITSIGLEYSGWAGSSAYGDALTSANYRLYPIQNGLIASGGNGEPFQWLRLTRGFSRITLPGDLDAIKITGQFGWEVVPAGVKAAVTIIATRILRRARENPMGFVALGVDGEALRAAAFAKDPEIQFMMQDTTMPQGLLL
jgi:hypothetical protein